MKNLIVIIIVLLLYSCTSKNRSSNNDNNTKQIELSRLDFPDSTKLIGQNIKFDSLISPYSFYVLRDSLLLVEYMDANPFYMELFNLNTQNRIAGLMRRGKGPYEALSASFTSNIYNYSNSNEIWTYDIVMKRVSGFNIDSLLHNKESYFPKQIDLPRYSLEFSKMNDSCFICFNSYYINDRKFNNKVDEIFRYKPSNEESVELTGKYFTFNVTGGYVLIAPQDDRILIPHFYEDRISIYNKELELIKILTGPDMIEPQYRLKGENHVSFIPRKEYRGYYPSCHTNNSIYIIYVGLNGIDSAINFRRPVEVFKFDWDGNPVKRYIMDRYIYDISISSDEKVLYGTYYDSVGEPKLVSYILN